MRIVFLCGSLEEGHDGVGDYVRRLAAELCKMGSQVSLISLKDKFIFEEFKGFQRCADLDLPVLRVPARWSRSKRFNRVKLEVNEIAPEWISLHFVLFSYQSKGLPFKIAKSLKDIGPGTKWQIMFHELWLGESRYDSLGKKVVGFFQKIIIKKILRTIKPLHIFTSNSFYQSCLSNSLSKVQVIPIFSSLPTGNVNGTALYTQLPIDVLHNRDRYIIATFFGGVDYTNLRNRIKILAEMVIKDGKELFISHIGKDQNAVEFFTAVTQTLGVRTIVFGKQSEQDISDFFLHVDIGLSTHPKIIFEKSSSIAAMLNNKLPIILLKNSFVSDNRSINYVKELAELTAVKDFVCQKRDFENDFGIALAAESYQNIFATSDL